MATKQTVRYSSFKEAYWAFKNRQDLDRTNPFYKALLKVLEEDAQKEADGVKVDSGTVFSEACCRFDVSLKKSLEKLALNSGGDNGNE